MKSKPIIRFILEYICINSFLYFATRLFEILIHLVSRGNGVHNGITLESFIEFSWISFIIGSILSCCAINWEYNARRDMRIQDEREIERRQEKLMRLENGTFYKKTVISYKKSYPQDTSTV
tara:strand:+ start:75 stop:437 length:363 start_codon:yes stop_codon:yes gene_type:complete